MLDLQNISEPTLPQTLNPASKFIAKAVPNPRGSGFLAQFASPGLVPRIVLDTSNDEPVVFSDERQAEAEARRVLFNVLNSGPPRDTASKSKLAAYEKLTGPEFAVMLAESELSPAWFAFIMATNHQRVMDWINGLQDVPHTARVMLDIFRKHPGAIDTAEAATTAVASDRVRKPRRDEGPG